MAARYLISVRAGAKWGRVEAWERLRSEGTYIQINIAVHHRFAQQLICTILMRSYHSLAPFNSIGGHERVVSCNTLS